MDLQYVVDTQGKRIAVIIPIEKWNNLTAKYPDLKLLEKTKVAIPSTNTSEKPSTPKP